MGRVSSPLGASRTLADGLASPSHPLLPSGLETRSQWVSISKRWYRGNAFAPFAPVRRADFRWTRSTPSIYRSSPIVERGFCRDCGTPLSFRYTDADWIDVSIGSLDHPDLVAPNKHVGTESRLPWLHLADDLPVSRTQESMRPDRIAKMQTFQHPDHDTPDDWAPKGVSER